MRRLGICMLTLSLIGCGSEYEIAPVSGRVTIDGEPMADLHVAFEPIGSPQNPNPGPGSIGITDADGRYTLATVPEDWRGAVVGPCRVRIRVISQAVDERATDFDPIAAIRSASKAQLPLRYHDQTELTFEVPPGGTDAANFDLTWE